MRERHVLQPWLLISTLCVTLSTLACTRSESPTAVVGETTAVPDERLETYVQARYQDDPQMRTHDVDVTVSSGVVTLRGTVPTAEAREHAATLAQQVNGVRSVDNQLQLRQAAEGNATGADATRGDAVKGAAPTTSPWRASDERSPAWITTKIQAQYFVNPEVKAWNVDVTTNSAGVVTLRGEVEQAKGRDEAVRIARETEGVTRVENQLRVKGETASSAATPSANDTGDAWVTAKVQAKFFVDPDVKGRNIDVDTQNGAVTLRGEVETEAERRQAIAIARSTEGVQSVTDQLQVRRDESTNPTPTREVATAIDDAWIMTKIQSRFFLDQLVKGRNIDVDVQRGVVTLKGSVSSSAERDAALAIARETEGVTRVVDRLTTPTAEHRDR